MATLTVVSDLHLEGRPLHLDEILDPSLVSDVLCLLGDIGDPCSAAYRDFIAACAARFRTVLLLAGNNEYRNHDGGGRTMAQTEELIRAATAQYPNVHFLQNSAHAFGDVVFIGTTLWSYLPDTPLPPPPSDGEESSSGIGGAPAAGHRAGVDGATAPFRTAGAAGADVDPQPQDAVAQLNVTGPAAAAVAAVKGGAEGGIAAAVAPIHPPLAAATLPIPAPSRQASRSMAAMPAGGGNDFAFRPPLAPPPPATAGRAPAAAPQQPRFMSYSQPPPDWLLSPALGTPCSSVNSGAGGVDGRACRRRRLRHCLSLSSLRPDEPCPSWPDIQARCRGGGGGGAAAQGGSGAASSSESDARSSDTDSSLSSDVSDAERSGETSRFDCSASAGGGLRMLEQLSLSPLATGTSGIAAAAAGAATSGLIAAQTAAAAAAAAARAAEESAVPSFLSDPGTLGLDGASGDSKDDSAAAITAAADVCSTSAPNPSPAAAAAAATVAAAELGNTPTPSPKSRHHSHHHHHHRHGSHSHLPPPSTIREFIGATSLDFRRIFLTPGGPAITPDVTNAIFMASLEFIRAAVAAARQQGLIPIVLSHHAPSMHGTSRPNFAGHPSTHAYSTDLEPYLAGSGVAAWYCGHTHYNFDMLLPGGVRLASNQFGSQPKPADGYLRTFQHRLPTKSSSSITEGCGGGSQVAVAATAAMNAAMDATEGLRGPGARAAAAAPPPPLGTRQPFGFGFGAVPTPTSAWAY